MPRYTSKYETMRIIRRRSVTTEVIDGHSERVNSSNLEMAFSSWRRERGATEED